MDMEKHWRYYVMLHDSQVMKQMGIEPCTIRDPFAIPLPLDMTLSLWWAESRSGEPGPPPPEIVLTPGDDTWLRSCGVLWGAESPGPRMDS
jgi:hypothetical protein